MMQWRIVDCALGLLGRARVKIGRWPHREVVNAAVASLRDSGAEACGESQSVAGEVQNLYFRLGGRRVRLCIEEYGDVTLYGPRRLVRGLAMHVAERLAAR